MEEPLLLHDAIMSKLDLKETAIGTVVTLSASFQDFTQVPWPAWRACTYLHVVSLHCHVNALVVSWLCACAYQVTSLEIFSSSLLKIVLFLKKKSGILSQKFSSKSILLCDSKVIGYV